MYSRPRRDRSLTITQLILPRRIDGASAKHIAEELNRLGVLSPMAYKESRGLPHPTGGLLVFRVMRAPQQPHTSRPENR